MTINIKAITATAIATKSDTTSPIQHVASHQTINYIDNTLCNPDNNSAFHNIYYISDIHIDEKLSKYLKKQPSKLQIKSYIKKLALSLFSDDLKSDIKSHQYPIVIFCGDTATRFEYAKIFYTEFINYWDRLEPHIRPSTKDSRLIYVILGNHEFWDFYSKDDCINSYKKFFKSLGLIFLNNDILTYDIHKYISSCSNIINNFMPSLTSPHKLLIIGGTGFAGYNSTFNADFNIYSGTINREQEIEECKNWEHLYNKAVALAKEKNLLLLVITHNPINDWCQNIKLNPSCIYFYGHDHRNYVYHNDDANTHIFADNQLGYISQSIHLKKANIYLRSNPFANYSDGYHKVTSSDYKKFYDFIGVNMIGNRTAERLMKKNNASFYMIKHEGYYGFFLVSYKGTYICSGGNIKKISPIPDITYFDTNFLKMVNKFIDSIAPYRNAQEQISAFIKSFGGIGRIHGCIIDIDYFNHIMLNPFDKKLTYYNSPEYGKLIVYSNILDLLKNNNKFLEKNYLKLLQTHQNTLELFEQSTTSIAETKINLSNSLYAISNKLNQLQRLFDNRVLRDWNDHLLDNIN